MRIISDLYSVGGSCVHVATIRIVFSASPREAYLHGQRHEYIEDVSVYWEDLSDNITIVVSALVANMMFTMIVEKSIALLSGRIVQPPGQCYQMTISIDDFKPDYMVLISHVDIKPTCPGLWDGMDRLEMISKITTDMVTESILMNGMRAE